MEQVDEFPFSPGQKVESKSNIKGFRGAWFRGEIKNIQIRRGEIWCAMHYIDFPDEKTNFMKAYQQDPSGKKKRVLMVRPSFPLISMGIEESISNNAARPVVVINGDWRVGDLVDWFTDGCYWAAKITSVINKEFVQLELPSAPYGEGGSYQAAVKDIRPSLDWSMDKLWTVPSVKLHPCAHTMDVHYGSLTTPVKDLETLDTEHIFIAKQEPGKTPHLQDLNGIFIGHEEAQLERKFWGPDSESEKGKVSDARGINKLITNNQHAPIMTGNFPNAYPVRTDKDTTVMSLDMQKNVASDSTLVTSLGDDQKFSSPDFYGRGLTSANKPPNEGQLGQPSTCEQGLGSSSFQRREEAYQLGNRATDCKALQKPSRQTNAIDFNVITGIEQKILSKSDALSTLNDMGETLFFKELNTLLGDEKLLDLSDERVSSSIVALEELISRITWLRGVMQLGLKGWCKERRKRKWVFLERESHPFTKSENDDELMQAIGLGDAL